MLKQQDKNQTLTPFIAARPKSAIEEGSTVGMKTKKPGAHLSKENATRDVLNRIVQRVKKI